MNSISGKEIVAVEKETCLSLVLRLELQKWYAINKVMIKLMLAEMTGV